MKQRGFGGVRKSVEDRLINGLDKKVTVSSRMLVANAAVMQAKPIAEMYQSCHLNAAGDRVWSF
jgi:hypothetical protein